MVVSVCTYLQNIQKLLLSKQVLSKRKETSDLNSDFKLQTATFR